MKSHHIILFVALALSCSYVDRTGQDREALANDFRRLSATVSCQNDERFRSTSELFKGHGLEFEAVDFERAVNLRVSVPGASDELIIVGAHYDKTTLGCGAIDNWTGVQILTKLAQETSKRKPGKSFRFVAFGEEEKGLWGSRAMVENLSRDEKSKTCAMVNLDSFGKDETWALRSVSTRKMLLRAADFERERGGSFSIREFRRASSDSKPFKDAGIPAITFSGIGNNWRDYLHKEGDQPEAVDPVKVAESYVFVRDFLRELEGAECSDLR